jgi:hypothetical protein
MTVNNIAKTARRKQLLTNIAITSRPSLAYWAARAREPIRPCSSPVNRHSRRVWAKVAPDSEITRANSSTEAEPEPLSSAPVHPGEITGAINILPKGSQLWEQTRGSLRRGGGHGGAGVEVRAHDHDLGWVHRARDVDDELRGHVRSKGNAGGLKAHRKELCLCPVHCLVKAVLT